MGERKTDAAKRACGSVGEEAMSDQGSYRLVAQLLVCAWALSHLCREEYSLHHDPPDLARHDRAPWLRICQLGLTGGPDHGVRIQMP